MLSVVPAEGGVLLVNEATGALWLVELRPRLLLSSGWCGVEGPSLVQVDASHIHVTWRDPLLADGALHLWMQISRVGSDAVQLVAHCKSRADRAVEIRELTLLDTELADDLLYAHTTDPGSWQSYPVLTRSWYVGLAFPAGYSVADQGHVRVGHRPGRLLYPGATFTSRAAVIGAAPAPGQALQALMQHITRKKRGGDRPHFDYNTWWSAGLEFDEGVILELVERVGPAFRARGTHVDSFTLDMGWSAREGIWQLSRTRFPRGLGSIHDALARYRTALGIWWSPSNVYSPKSFDSVWAAREGFETFELDDVDQIKDPACCIALDGRYQREARAAMAELASAGVAFVKHDGWIATCPSTQHRHLSGDSSTEAMVEGLVDVIDYFRTVTPGAFMEPTFLVDPSPWWLAHMDSVPGLFGDDAPCGSVPAPVYRDSYTTARDYFNISSRFWPVPAREQDLLGLVHQTPEPIYNDAVMCVMRGQRFLSLYVNPRHMTDLYFDFLADLMKWARLNWHVLRETHILAPDGWRDSHSGEYANAGDLRRPYGYLHRGSVESILCFRNPWMDYAAVDVPVEPDQPNAVQVYPFPRLLEPHHGNLRLRLGSYETVVIHLTRSPVTCNPIPDLLADALASVHLKRSARHESQDEVIWEVGGVLDRPARLYCLVESGSNQPLMATSAEAAASGRPMPLEVRDSEAGWWDCPPAHKVNSWRWYIGELGAGELSAQVRLRFERSARSLERTAAWLAVPFQSPLPSPEPELPAFPIHPEYEGLASIPIG